MLPPAGGRLRTRLRLRLVEVGRGQVGATPTVATARSAVVAGVPVGVAWPPRWARLAAAAAPPLPHGGCGSRTGSVGGAPVRRRRATRRVSRWAPRRASGRCLRRRPGGHLGGRGHVGQGRRGGRFHRRGETTGGAHLDRLGAEQGRAGAAPTLPRRAGGPGREGSSRRRGRDGPSSPPSSPSSSRSRVFAVALLGCRLLRGSVAFFAVAFVDAVAFVGGLLRRGRSLRRRGAVGSLTAGSCRRRGRWRRPCCRRRRRRRRPTPSTPGTAGRRWREKYSKAERVV